MRKNSSAPGFSAAISRTVSIAYETPPRFNSRSSTTAAGMEKMDVPEFKKIVAATLAAAAKRSKELA